MQTYFVNPVFPFPVTKHSLVDRFNRLTGNFILSGAKEINSEKSDASAVCDDADESGMNKLTIKGQSESRIFLIPRLNTIEAQKLNRVVSVPDQQNRAQWCCEPAKKFALATIPQDPALCPPMV